MKLKKECCEQIAVFDYIRSNNKLADISFHPANEGKRGIVAGKILKRMGLLPGVPDVYIDHARGGYHGLRIEIKIPPNKPTDSQIKVMNALRKEGYKGEFCYSADEAIKIIVEYLELPKV